MIYFSEPHTHSKNKIKVELYFPNYATKSDLKNAAVVDTSDFSEKADLASLKSDVDKSDIDKLKMCQMQIKNVPSTSSNFKSKLDKLDVSQLTPTSVDLKKLSAVVDNDFVKKTEYDE